jgi:hypothetical protein
MAAELPSGDFKYDVRGLFRATAEATVTAQKELDGALAASYCLSCETDSQRMLYTIPRTSVQFRFGVVEESGGGWRLIPWKQTLKREQMHVHELKFYVDAMTEAPPKVSSANGATVSFHTKSPYFMLTPAQEEDLAKQLLAALDPATRSWVSAIPGTVKDLEKLVLREFKDLRTALGKNESEKGPVFFRLESSPQSYLVVRVVGKDANDSIFVVTPEASPQVVIHSLDGDEVKSVSYQPLHHLLHTIRRSQEGALAPVLTDDVPSVVASEAEAVQTGTGLRGLVPFAEDIRAGYASGLAYLAESKAESFWQVENAQLTPSVFYDFTGVQARLTYSLGYRQEGEQQRPSLDFGIRRTSFDDPLKAGEEPDEVRLIESSALIRATRDAFGPRTEVELKAPEFVLSGAARDRLLKLTLDSDADADSKIQKAFRPNGKLYSGFIKNEDYQRRVVALLSYRGSPPKEEFLIVWPGDFVGKSRDFAFTCGLNDSRTRLDDVKRVFGVEDDLTDVQLTNNNDEAAATGEQYRPFHNFFHAVRIWRARSIL